MTKLGRPPLKDKSKLRVNVTIRLTDVVKKDLQAEAARAGRSLSEEIELRLGESLRAQRSLVGTLESVTAELKDVVKGEACDHSVGICWCQTFRAIEQAEEILKQGKE